MDVYAASCGRTAKRTAAGCPQGKRGESQASEKITAEIGETGRFQMKTSFRPRRYPDADADRCACPNPAVKRFCGSKRRSAV